MSTWSIVADSSEHLGRENSAVRRDLQETSAADLHELLTVSEVAALLKVSRSWVYQHTRSRGTPRSDRLPSIKLGKYVRFDPRAVPRLHRTAMPDNVIPFPAPDTIGAGLNREEPTRGKEVSRMARRKRQYGSGCLLAKGRGWVIRWRELEIAPDGTTKRVLRYENLGWMSRREAADILAQKLAGAAGRKTPTRSRVTFRTLVNEWQATVVPMYKPSTQKNHRHIAAKHSVPRFGDKAVSDITRQEVQAYVAHLTQAGYAPKTIDHMHDVLSAVLRTAVKWGHVQENASRH